MMILKQMPILFWGGDGLSCKGHGWIPREGSSKAEFVCPDQWPDEAYFTMSPKTLDWRLLERNPVQLCSSY
jgi:hypothetical protein